MDQYTNKIKKVTSEQIQMVAKKYLVDEALTLVTLDPQPLDPNYTPQGKPHVH
jgi:zinc protease